MIMTYLIIYWILSTIYGIYWAIKHPPEKLGLDMEYFSLFEVIGLIFPCSILAPIFIPIMLLSQIKFKRNKSGKT